MKKKINILSIVFSVIFLGTALISPPPPPPGIIAPYLNGAFPDTSPNTSWELEDALPDFTFKDPLRLTPLGGTNEYLLLCKSGELWQVSFEDQSRELVLDIRNRTLDKSEAGTVGMALHPNFGDSAYPDHQTVFIFYRYKPNSGVWDHNGYNRLSKFSWDDATRKFDPNSEDILIQQFDRNAYHNGGGMFFGNDGFLYLSVGDEGILSNHPAEVPNTTQRLDKGLFSGLLRIDVDNDPDRSHPIIKQPQFPDTFPAGWPPSYTQGYSIPNDNPWLSPDGSHLEEFYAIGFRSPYSTHYDKVADRIWMADVGGVGMEEISVVERESNLQWPYLEATLPSNSFTKPADLIGFEQPPYHTYERSVGTCVIGGGVYRGTKYPQLTGKYLYSDWAANKIWAIPEPDGTTIPTPEVLVDNISGGNVEMPEKPGVTGIFLTRDEEIMVTVMTHNQQNIGKIYRLVRKVETSQVVEKLSEVGAFADLADLTPIEGLLPYQVNAPLWSDRAIKKRWMALANDGNFDTPQEKIIFSKNSEWTFPAGTVFVKHFELPLTTDPNGSTARLETRFFIIDKNGQGYGLTYVWNDEGTEAFLQKGDASKDFEIMENGSVAFTQTWDFPSTDQCLSCHNHNAQYVLGVKTHQLNATIEYPSLGLNMNQLNYLNEVDAFHRDIDKATAYSKAVAINDESADLDLKIRSYFDSNCSSCHRPGGVNQVNMDFRFSTPLSLMNIINHETLSHASPFGRLLVEPGSHAASEIWQRDASLAENRMPPLASNLVDEEYIDALAEWIDGLPQNAGAIKELLVFPNPSSGLFNVRVYDDWEGDFSIAVYTTSGQVLLRQRSEEHAFQVDLSGFPAGHYLIDVSGSDGNKKVRKLLKW